MGLTGTIAGHVEISSGGNILHDLLRDKPNDIPSLCSSKMHRWDLLSGEKGVVGSTICWNYTYDGKTQASKQIIKAIDEANHKIVFKVIGGELVEEFKAFTIIFHVEPKGGKQLVTWTFEFEKPNDSTVPDPTLFMDYLCGVLKEMADNACPK